MAFLKVSNNPEYNATYQIGELGQGMVIPTLLDHFPIYGQSGEVTLLSTMCRVVPGMVSQQSLTGNGHCQVLPLMQGKMH